ncbi:MAG: hypothetical protein RL660_295 [Bacteroidota bacterium]|jgi:hypothetical protein
MEITNEYPFKTISITAEKSLDTYDIVLFKELSKTKTR